MRLARPFIRARNYWPFELRGLVLTEGFTIIERSWLLPVFEKYAWLPTSVIHLYRKAVPLIEQIPLLRKLGVSTFIVAQKPTQSSILDNR